MAAASNSRSKTAPLERADRDGRIGPNAITQAWHALAASEHAPAIEPLFKAAGIERYLASLPEAMVQEREVAALHRELERQLGPAVASSIAIEAGRRTAGYLLANRIPAAARTLLRLLPPGLASTLLLRAIGAHAWTFAGSGTVVCRAGRPTMIAISGGALDADRPTARSLSLFYAATILALFAELVTRTATVSLEITHPVARDDAVSCCLELDW